MPEWNWQLYGSHYTPEYPTDGPILCHEIYSKNGAYGECLICFDGREDKPWFIIAGGNDTGRLWKSPDETYSTVDEAKQAAEKFWKPIERNLLNDSKEIKRESK